METGTSLGAGNEGERGNSLRYLEFFIDSQLMPVISSKPSFVAVEWNFESDSQISSWFQRPTTLAKVLMLGWTVKSGI